jgi:hypothetical protein
MQPDNHLIKPTSREVFGQPGKQPASRLGKTKKEAVVANIFGLFGPEDEGRMIPRNTRKYIPNDPVSQLKRKVLTLSCWSHTLEDERTVFPGSFS